MDSTELPDGLTDDLLRFLDGPKPAFWPAVERLCQQHPQAAVAIRRLAAELADVTLDAPATGTSNEKLRSRLANALVEEVFAIAFGEVGTEDRDELLRRMCDREPAVAAEIRAFVDVLREQVQDMRRRLGTVFGFSRFAGRYEPLGPLGKGGFGTVLVVRDRLLGRRVAFKTIHPKHGERLDAILPVKVHRFLDEAQVAAQLQHPGIPPVHDVGIGPLGVPYYTMRCVRGRTLAQMLDPTTGAWSGPLREGVRILATATEAVAYAHAQGVLHRDLKPDNILVGRFGEVCVIDWGLARAPAGETESGSRSRVRIDRRVDLQSSGLGTPGFIAPEQWLGDFHAASDVFSLAAILLVFLVGMPPTPLFTDAAWGAPHSARLRDPWLAAICERGLAPRLEDRYATSAAFLTDLRAYLADRVPAAAGQGFGLRLPMAWNRLRQHWQDRRGARPDTKRREDSRRQEASPQYTLAAIVAPPRANAGARQHDGGRRGELLGTRLASLKSMTSPAARYGTGDRLGRGGMSEVFRARDLLLGRDVAVKSALTCSNPDVVGRLLDEAQIAAQLDHPGVLTVHEIIVDDGGEIHVVLPLLPGGTLADALRGGMAWPVAARHVLQAAWGLAFAHQKGVVHRDVKPSNILLGRHGDAYLGDWGLALLFGAPGEDSCIGVVRGGNLDARIENTESDETEGSVVGTPMYMAPEAFAGELAAIRPQADVWSLGITLYEVLTGMHPFAMHHIGALDFTQMARTVVMVPATPVRNLNRRVPRSVADVCQRALERDPADRYRSAAEFARALAAALR